MSLALFTADRLPKKPYCSDDKTAKWIRPTAAALRCPSIQPNPPGMLYWLVFDIDRNDGASHFEDVIAPPPNIVVVNPGNGHAHYYYALKTPVNTGEKGRRAPQQFAEAVYRGLGAILDADSRYTRLLAKNPLHPSHISFSPCSEPYELAELDEYIVDRQAGRKWQEAARSRGLEVNPLGRNCTEFDSLRHWAYNWVREYQANGASFDEWLTACHGQAEALNEFPGHTMGNLSPAEVKATAKSVAKWTWHRYDGRGGKDPDFPALQAARGRLKGAQKRDELLPRAVAMKAAGHSNKTIAVAIGVTAPTVSNWLKRREGE